MLARDIGRVAMNFRWNHGWRYRGRRWRSDEVIFLDNCREDFALAFGKRDDVRRVLELAQRIAHSFYALLKFCANLVAGSTWVIKYRKDAWIRPEIPRRELAILGYRPVSEHRRPRNHVGIFGTDFM